GILRARSTRIRVERDPPRRGGAGGGAAPYSKRRFGPPTTVGWTGPHRSDRRSTSKDPMVSLTVLAFAIIAAVVLVSAFVQGSTGMGFAMLLAPVVTFIDPSLIPVMLLVLMIPLNFYVAAREREHIDWTGVSWISI